MSCRCRNHEHQANDDVIDWVLRDAPIDRGRHSLPLSVGKILLHRAEREKEDCRH